MESEKISNDNNHQNNILNDNLQNIKSNDILSKIYDNIKKKKSLEIVKCNRQVQKRLKLSIKDYKKYH